jgi:hypothetical protein
VIADKLQHIFLQCDWWYQVVGSSVPRGTAPVIDYVLYGRIVLVVPYKDIASIIALMDWFV